MEVSHMKYKISVYSNIALFTIATVTEVTISESFYQGITSFYVHYMAIQVQVVSKLNFTHMGNTQHVHTVT